MSDKMPCSITDGLQEPGDEREYVEEDEDEAYERVRQQEIDDRIAHNTTRELPMILIGIHGKGGSGKDTVGEILRDKHDFEITAFAAPIKEMICGLLDVREDKWDDREWREIPIELFGNKSPRYMAQTIGTEWGRMQLSETLWLDLTLSKISVSRNVAITDVRFDNEAERIRQDGGYMIIVHRTESDLHTIAQGHRSERGLRDGYAGTKDFHINNFGTLKNLEVQVAQVVDQIFNREEEKRIEEIQSDAADPAGTDN